MAYEPDPQRLLRLFLCHSSKDREAVRSLYLRLRSAGIAAWLDKEDLLPGQDWHLEIKKAINNADVVLVCLSCDSVSKSGFVQKEIKYALDVADQQPEGEIFIIPIKLEECNVPNQLSRWQWVDMVDEKGYEKLITALYHRANSLGIKIRDKGFGEINNSQPCQLLDSISNLKKILGNSLSLRNIQLEIRIDPFLVVDVPLVVLTFALANLVANAKDVLDKGGVIRIESEEIEDWVYCHVIDDGPGIHSSIRDKVLNQIIKTEKRDSYGVGLYFTSQSLRLYGGEIVLSGTDDKGTKFSIQLPKSA